MTAQLIEVRPADTGPWRTVCRLDDLEVCWGEAALVEGRQIALFRVTSQDVYAVSHRDPVSGAYVMARGIVGSEGHRFTIASPLHKEVYDLGTGVSMAESGVRLRCFPVRVADGAVQVQLTAR